MRNLAWSSGFRRAFRKRTRNNPALQERIFHVLDRLVQNPFSPSLRTHKLSGRLQGLWACWVEYDCRIVFAFEPDEGQREDLIVLIDLGTHNEVY